MFTKLLCALFICVQILPIVAQDVPLWGKFETRIDYQALKGQSHSYSDPFYGVELNATFTSPTGRSITWWGFYDGNGSSGQSGNIWKIRYMPDELGAWTYTWKFSDNSLNGNGSFNAVSAGARPGPLKHDSNIHQWLVTADGSRHVFLNMYSEWKASNKTPWDSPQAAIDRVKNAGMEVIAVWSPEYYSESAYHIWQNHSSFIPNLVMWHRMEKGLYQKCYEQGIYLYEWDGFYSGNGLHNLEKVSGTLQDRVIKYWLAREAPYYMILFNIGFELQEYVSVPSWPVARAQYVKSIDPFNHLLTAHELRSFSYGNYPIIDFSATQQYNYSSYHSNALSIWNSPAKPHPHLSEGVWNGPWGRPSSETAARKAYWDMITGGQSYFYYPRDDFMGLSAVKAASAFLKDVKWWTMSPHDELKTSGNAWIIADPGKEYVAFSESGSSFSLNLSAGTYQYRWYDPTNGNYNNVQNITSNGGSITLNKPNSGHWVLHLIGDGDTIPPDTTPTDTTGAILFQDDFSDDLSAWETVQGNPSIQNGQLVLRSTGSVIVRLKNSQSYKNIAIEFDLTILPEIIYGMGNVWFRKANNTWYQYTIEKYNATGAVTNTPTRLRIFKDNEEPALKSVTQEFPVNQKKRVRIDVNGKKIDVYQDGVFILSYTANNMNDAGGIEIEVYRGEWRVDNFIVRNLDAPTVNYRKAQIVENNLMMIAAPNPFYPTTTIQMTRKILNFSNRPVLLKIHDVTGAVVHLDETTVSAFRQGYLWHAGNLPNGVYLVDLQIEGKRLGRKIILQR